jgi:hypothetical protein
MAKQDYLTEKGEVEMTWYGQGSARLGLSGQVTDNDFAMVCDGLHPKTNEKLIVPVNGANRRVCYFGQISAPKDTSIAYLVGGDCPLSFTRRRGLVAPANGIELVRVGRLINQKIHPRLRGPVRDSCPGRCRAYRGSARMEKIMRTPEHVFLFRGRKKKDWPAELN